MTTVDPDSPVQRTATRAPVGKPIKLQFDDSLDVSDGVCRNVSIGGMFIVMEATRQPGSLVRFELSVDESTAIRGLGEVVWSLGPEEASEREPGIGIKFRFLEQRDRQLIFKLVSQHIKERLARRQTLDVDAAATAPEVSPPTPEPAAAVPAPVTPAAREPAPAEPAVPEPESARPEPRPAVTSYVGSSPEPGEAAVGHAEFDAELESLEEASAWAEGAGDGSSAPAEEPAGDETPYGRGVVDPESAGGDALDLDHQVFDTGAFGDETLEGEDLEPDHYPAPEPRRAPAGILVVALLAVVAVAVFLLRDRLFGGGNQVPAVSSSVPGDAGAEPVERPAPAIAPPPPADPPPVPAAEPDPPPSGIPEAAAERRRASPELPAFSRVLDISWDRAAGGVEVVIETDGAVPDGRFRHFRLGGDSPREVIRILGVRRWDRGEIPADGALVRRIRTGFHPKRGGDELHVVLDLADPEARVEDVLARDSRLVVRVTRP